MPALIVPNWTYIGPETKILTFTIEDVLQYIDSFAFRDLGR
jgi:hypothetical protein